MSHIPSMSNLRQARFTVLAVTLVATAISGVLVSPLVDAGPRARAGGHAAGAVNRPAASRPASRPSGQALNKPANRPTGQAAANRGSTANRANVQNRSNTVNRNTNINNNVNRNTNINVDRDVNIDVDNGWHNDWDHPFATAAAVTAGVAVTSAVIGSIVYSVPPSCVTTVINGIAYQQCGSTWYQPQYSGSQVQYIVVNPP